MSDRNLPAEPRLGYLLLRENHAVPLRGISPFEIKAGAKHHIPNPEIDRLKHRRLLDAIVDRLGFRGDFGTFTNHGWPDFQKFLLENGCQGRAGLFPVDHGGCIDLHFTAFDGPTPEQLADRIFVGGIPPEPVFLGYGVDWSAWDEGNGHDVPARAAAWIPGDRQSAESRARLLFASRHALMGQWGFLDDKLFRKPLETVVAKTYWVKGSDPADRKQNADRLLETVKAFRAVFDSRPEGWVDILRYNERLVVLKAHTGEWDLLWRSYRENEPPEAIAFGQSLHMSVEDLPLSLMDKSDRRRLVHFRQEAWAERDAHGAEQAFYERGGSIADRRMSSDADVLLAWAHEQGIVATPDRARLADVPPPGFKAITVNGRRLAVSSIVTVGEFRRMLSEFGYWQRRVSHSEDWERANGLAGSEEFVGATWTDAQAFCAWMERQLRVAVRLPTREELRALRPAYSQHYERLAQIDFPWEHFPPRPIHTADGDDAVVQAPSAVCWSEARFRSPEATKPALPKESGVASTSLKRWIEDFPPRASWVHPLPVQTHHGLDFIDAWDAYEWCQERGWVSGRFWEGTIGSTSWGAYKSVKITFRVVLDIGG